MVNYLNGKTDRFKCFVNHDGEFNSTTSYYSTEELYFMEYEFNGPPFENDELYEKFSPHKYVKNWKTPMMVIHGKKDFRLTEIEGISTFTALQRKGIDSKFLYFEDENHFVSKPLNSIEWHNEVKEWLSRYNQ